MKLKNLRPKGKCRKSDETPENCLFHSETSISSENPPSCLHHPILMKAPNQVLKSNIAKQHRFPQELQPLQLIINQFLPIPAHHLIFHQVIIPFLRLKKKVEVSTRTYSCTSINLESSDEQNNPPPQMSPQAVSSRFQNNKNNLPTPPPPKVVILNPAPSIAPSSK
ncbi:hypothetical protein O181_092299 [Austropuccinia psidii MF-1]|uniref:Uncharacterized protein n=1 Tax=Austropuccinia psidii MF-1 TaxID=1389203 RepID=A0A9Q3IZ00_9BASI|nr:hypothetical protein [Austropuccinia psidii MF-1]